MNVTFMIGNGFDLACGMDTRYSDIYTSYINLKSPHIGVNLAHFRHIMCKNHDKWADFEASIPKIGKELGDWDSFQECITDFTLYVDDYLKKEEEKFQNSLYSREMSKVINSSFFSIFEYCLLKSKEHLKKKLVQSSGTNSYNFITFNYTSTLEHCFKKNAPIIAERGVSGTTYHDKISKEPLHIHGELGTGILLGMDNFDQYKDLPFSNEVQLKNLIDKIHLNTENNARIVQAKDLIYESDMIVVYGWSFGMSDLTWVNYLRETFNRKKNLDIVFAPYYKEPSDIRIIGAHANREEEEKKKFIAKLGLKEADAARVHIVVKDSFMNMPKLATV